MLSSSSTTQWRISVKIILGLVLLWTVFFGKFIINGGMGMLKTNYYRKVTLEVPDKFDTILKNITILTTNGTLFGNSYNYYYSYKQILFNLNCS
jgi:hypothetical protein